MMAPETPLGQWPGASAVPRVPEQVYCLANRPSRQSRVTGGSHMLRRLPARLVAVLVVVSLALSAGWGSSTPARAAGAKPGGKIVYGAWQDPDTLDPQRTGLAAATRVL